MQRRIAYLEALLLRIVRFEIEMREWFSASDLHMMFLPGLRKRRLRPIGIWGALGSASWVRWGASAG